ncbi:hypothetical protein ABKW28_01505 [Nocardioides sp. 31GB23]|uniref:hypothetical protein n=1 Tax=Nocardioides sp. 31GB23 TaxID=3156065 RepID=UPI0032AFBC44
MTTLDLALVAQLAVLHLGSLHPVERVLTLALAFGPFVVLGAVVWWRSRQDQDDQDDGEQVPTQRDR